MDLIRNKLLILLFSLLLPSPAAAVSVYETQKEFVGRAFNGSSPEPGVVWLSGERKLAVKKILGHDYAALRLRFWCQEQRSAWILDEIGKELPITVGVIINNDYIESLRVLTYRENRGGEVSTPSFTDQFNGVTLDDDGALDARIDGISGATLSVRALTRLAELALFLHADTGCKVGA
jgi:hypothetical protein